MMQQVKTHKPMVAGHGEQVLPTRLGGFRQKTVVAAVLLLIFGASGAASLHAQDASPASPNKPAVALKPKPAKNPWTAPPTSKLDIFGGYSYWKPSGMLSNGNSFQAIDDGFDVAATYFFTRKFGATFDFGDHPESSNDGAATFLGGVTYREPLRGFTPFAHVLGGEAHFTGANVPTIGTSSFFYNPAKYGPVFSFGGGLDYEPAWKHHRLGVRVLEADYQHLNADFGPIGPTSGGGDAKLNVLRLSAGVVAHFGNQTPEPYIGYSCSTAPGIVYPGEPVVVTGVVAGADPRKPLRFSWASVAGKIAAKGNVATIDTTHLAAGTYMVEGRVTQGPAANQEASCRDGFVIRQYPLPSVKCTASPERVSIGQLATIHAEGTEPGPYTLAYTFKTTMGDLQPNGSDSATLQTSGQQEGAARVTCTVTDEAGRTASDMAIVIFDEPTLPPHPKSKQLCSISFARDKKRPTRVDNEAKACLDDIALGLEHSIDSKLVIIGETDLCQVNGDIRAGQRAVNTADYLIKEKSIDPSRIELRLGHTAVDQVDNFQVPAGAIFTDDVPLTVPAEPLKLKPEPRIPLPLRHPAHVHPHGKRKHAGPIPR